MPSSQPVRGFERPATVIGESPDDASNQAIRAVLFGERGRPAPAASDRLFPPE